MNEYDSQSFDYKTIPLAERINEARRLYQEAGYSSSNPLRFRAPLQFRRSAYEIGRSYRIGVEERRWGRKYGSPRWNSNRCYRTSIAGTWRCFRSSWVGDYNDAYTYLQYLKSDFGINLPHYKNPDYDLLLARAATEIDSTRRRDLLEEAERLMLRDHPLLPIYFYVNQAPRKARSRRLVRQHHECRLQQGSRTAPRDALSDTPALLTSDAGNSAARAMREIAPPD